MIYLLIPISLTLFFKWKLEQWEFKQYRERNPELKTNKKSIKNIQNDYIEHWELAEEEYE
jgi:hypothetical protein